MGFHFDLFVASLDACRTKLLCILQMSWDTEKSWDLFRVIRIRVDEGEYSKWRRGWPWTAPWGLLTLEGLRLQVAISEGGSESQGVTTDKRRDFRRGEGQEYSCVLVQQTWHPAGYSAFRACKSQRAESWGGVPSPSWSPKNLLVLPVGESQ